MPVVANLDPVAWPERDGAGHQAALACVAAALGLPADTPIEDNYETNTDIDWDGKGNELSRLTFAKTASVLGCDGGGSTQTDFTDVQGQLETEFSDVETIQHNLIPNLQAPLLGGQLDIETSFNDIVQAVQAALAPPDASTQANGLQIATDVLWIASYIPVAGDALGIGAGIMQLAVQPGRLANRKRRRLRVPRVPDAAANPVSGLEPVRGRAGRREPRGPRGGSRHRPLGLRSRRPAVPRAEPRGAQMTGRRRATSRTRSSPTTRRASCKGPPLPSQLRFDLETIGRTPHQLTRDPNGICLVDGKQPN